MMPLVNMSDCRKGELKHIISYMQYRQQITHDSKWCESTKWYLYIHRDQCFQETQKCRSAEQVKRKWWHSHHVPRRWTFARRSTQIFCTAASQSSRLWRGSSRSLPAEELSAIQLRMLISNFSQIRISNVIIRSKSGYQISSELHDDW